MATILKSVLPLKIQGFRTEKETERLRTLIFRSFIKEPLLYLQSDSPSVLFTAGYNVADTKHKLVLNNVCIQNVLWAGKFHKGMILLSFTPYLPAFHLCIIKNNKTGKETELLISFTTACRSDCLLILNNEVVSFPIPLAGMFSNIE